MDTEETAPLEGNRGKKTHLRSPAAAGWQLGACRAWKLILVKPPQPPEQLSLEVALVCGDGPELRQVQPGALYPALGRGEPLALVPAQPNATL